MTFLGVQFSQAHNLWMALLIVAVIVLSRRTQKLRRRLIELLKLESKPEIVASLPRPRMRRLKSLFVVAGLLSVWLAALGPTWGQKETALKTEGLDLCVAIDLSTSMLSEDQSPNRLQLAKNQLSIFLPRLGGDRVSLVGFGGTGFIAAPLTIDYAALIGFLQPLDPSYMSDRTTRIANGVDSCLTALSMGDVSDKAEVEDTTSKVILLMSDGEDQDALPEPVKRAKKLGVQIFAMAYGTEAGGPIPLRDDKGQLLEYLKDPRTNQPVSTKIQDKALKAITDECAGEIYYGSGGLSAWNAFEKDLSNLKRASKEAGSKLDQEERYQWPLLLGFLILLFDFWVPEMRWPWRKAALVIALAAMGLKTQSAWAFDATDPRLIQRNNSATQPFQEGDFTKTEKALNRALEIDATDRRLRTNWATTKIFQSLLEEGKVDPMKLKAAQGELESLLQTSRDAGERALLNYQLGHVSELQNKIPDALSHYYSVLLENHDALGTNAKNNIARLLTQQESKQGQSSGQGDSSDQKQKGEQQQPKDGDQASQQKQKPKYSGTDLSENEAKQILESVSGEERDVQRRKARAESREKGSRKGQERGKSDGSGNPW